MREHRHVGGGGGGAGVLEVEGELQVRGIKDMKSSKE
jgi:hypothetical protein